MFRRLPTFLIIHFLVVLGCGVSLSTTSLADYFETPRYGGDILPITTPVSIQYRPFPKVPFTSKQITKIFAKGETQTATEILYGTYQGKRLNEGIQLMISLDRTEKISRANKETQKVSGTLSVFVNATGDAQDVKIQIPGLDTSKSNNQLRDKNFRITLRKSVPEIAERRGSCRGSIVRSEL